MAVELVPVRLVEALGADEADVDAAQVERRVLFLFLVSLVFVRFCGFLWGLWVFGGFSFVGFWWILGCVGFVVVGCWWVVCGFIISDSTTQVQAPKSRPSPLSPPNNTHTGASHIYSAAHLVEHELLAAERERHEAHL